MSIAAAVADEKKSPSEPGIQISVLDAGDRRPLGSFRVLAGVPSAGVSQEFEQRTGRKVIAWQAHTIRAGQEGKLFWSTKRSYQEMALRVEADGFVPQQSELLKSFTVPQKLEFLLVKDPGIHGRIIQPDGGPAVGATIALALPLKGAIIEGGRIRREGDPLPKSLRDRWDRPTLVKTDALGGFSFPTETDPAAAVLIVHDSGVRAIPYEEFARQPNQALLPWGSIDGRVQWQDTPGDAKQQVTLSVYRDEYGYPGMIGSYAETETDAQGRIVFDKVLPGTVQVSLPIEVPRVREKGTTRVILDGMYAHAKIRPGEPTPVVIGGQGRSVTGRLTGRDSWNDVTFHLHPNAPHIGWPGDDEQWQAFGKFRGSPIGPLFFRDKLMPKADGSFEIPRLLPGKYQMFVSAPGIANFAAATVIRVDPETPGEPPTPLDLGKIAIKPAQR